MCAAAGKWCAEDRARVVGRAGAVGPAGRQARGRRREDRLHRRDHVRASRRCWSCLRSWPTRAARTSGSRPRWPSCGPARWRGRSPTSWCRSAVAEATRPPTSLAARGERAVPAEQMLRDLRINRIFEGSTRDHAPADRPGGRRRAPQGRGRPGRRRRRPVEDKARAAAGGERVLREVAAAAGGRARASAPTSYAEFGPLAEHLRYVERSCRKLARQTFYGMSRWQAKLEYRQGFLGRIVDIGAELFAMAAACSRAEMLRADDPERGEAAYAARRRVLRPGRLRVDDAVRPAVDQHRRHRPPAGRRVLAGELHLARGGRARPERGHRAVDRLVGAGPERGRVGLAPPPVTSCSDHSKDHSGDRTCMCRTRSTGSSFTNAMDSTRGAWTLFTGRAKSCALIHGVCCHQAV